VEFSDTDMAGIVHFAAFFRYMESAEHALLRSLGLSVHSEIDGQVVSFPRVSAHCDFRSPARCEDELTIEVAVSRIGGKSVTYTFRVLHDATLVAEGNMTSVCCRLVGDGRPVSIALPGAIAEKLATYAVD
jgi:4-hydroxybenzoyl-CoA thioesterase/acyl-CoA thioester hydrolase